MSKRYISPEQFGEKYSVEARHARDLVRQGKLPAIRVGKLIRIDAEAAEEKLLATSKRS